MYRFIGTGHLYPVQQLSALSLGQQPFAGRMVSNRSTLRFRGSKDLTIMKVKNSIQG